MEGERSDQIEELNAPSDMIRLPQIHSKSRGFGLARWPDPGA